MAIPYDNYITFFTTIDNNFGRFYFFNEKQKEIAPSEHLANSDDVLTGRGIFSIHQSEFI